MKRSEKKKLITTNAAILAAGMFASFVLPLIIESVTDGRADFLKMMMQMFPLIVAMMASTGMISKTIGEPTD
jgi:hypothetical protein